MKNQYFLKDKKARIYVKQASTQDAEGYPIPGGWRPTSASDLWCYSKQLSQETVLVASQYGSEETRLFVFNPTTVKQYDLILYRSTWYEVTRVDTTDDYNTDVFVYVKDCPTGSIPRQDKILPYAAS